MEPNMQYNFPTSIKRSKGEEKRAPDLHPLVNGLLLSMYDESRWRNTFRNRMPYVRWHRNDLGFFQPEYTPLVTNLKPYLIQKITNWLYNNN